MIDLLTDLLLANGSGSIKNTQLKRMKVMLTSFDWKHTPIWFKFEIK